MAKYYMSKDEQIIREYEDNGSDYLSMLSEQRRETQRTSHYQPVKASQAGKGFRCYRPNV